VKTLHTAYRVTGLAASLDFYIALGYGEVGHVDIGDGASLTMLKFPARSWSPWSWPAGRPANLWTSGPASVTSSSRPMVSLSR
jgi:hypothetical protein